jgi:nifR3 family TIM-barrel protein
MKLGTLVLENNLLLAPLQKVTTAPYRRFCREFGKIGLVSVPMLYTKRIQNNPRSVLSNLHKIEKERPISVQLIGSDPIALRESIDFLESYQFDVLDINAGCPSKKAIKAKEGGYLLNDLKKLSSLIKIATKYSSHLVSLKIRTGFKNSDNINNLAKIINKSSVDFITIHGRTVKDRFVDTALDLKAVKRLKELLKKPVVGNGSINSPQSAKMFLDFTKVDAIMIGRETMGNPEIFHQINTYLKEGVEQVLNNNLTKLKKHIELYEHCINNYLDENIEFPYPIERYKFVELKRNSIWLTQNIHPSTDIRIKISRTKTLDELRDIFEQIFDN